MATEKEAEQTIKLTSEEKLAVLTMLKQSSFKGEFAEKIVALIKKFE